MCQATVQNSKWIGREAAASSEYTAEQRLALNMFLECDTPKPAMHPKSAEFCAILDEMKALHLKKGADYGTATDPFQNVRASEGFGIPAWLGIAVRMNDKMSRLKAFATKGELKNESLEDSFIDIAVYAAIAIVLYRETLRETVRDDTGDCDNISLDAVPRPAVAVDSDS